MLLIFNLENWASSGWLHEASNSFDEAVAFKADFGVNFDSISELDAIVFFEDSTVFLARWASFDSLILIYNLIFENISDIT